MPISFTADNYSNFATSTVGGGALGIGADVGIADTTITLAAGDGAKFPSTAPFNIVAGPNTPSPEIWQVTARSGDALTVLRAQEGTIAPTNWPVGTILQHTVTAGNMANIWNTLAAMNSAAANNIILTGETAGNDIVRTLPTGYGSNTLHFKDDGTFKVRGLTGVGVESDFIIVTPYAGGVAASVLFHGTADLASALVSGALWNTATGNIAGAYSDDSGNTRTVLAPSAPGGTARAQAIAGLDSSGVKHPGIVVNSDGSTTILGNLTVNGTSTLSGGAAAVLILSGETAPTTMVRSQPSGYSGYSVNMIDTGQFEIRAISNGTLTDMIIVTPGSGVTAASALFHGTADKVPTTGVQSGTFGAGVILPASQVGTGTLPSSVAVQAASLSGAPTFTGLTVSGWVMDSTGLPTKTVTLSTTTRDLAVFTATDGKVYKWQLTGTGNQLRLFNSTDSVSVVEFGPGAGIIKANGNTVWHAGNDGVGSGLDADTIQGTPIVVSSSTPAGTVAGRIWIDTSVNLG